MKLLIAGSRSIAEFDLAPYIPTDTDMIISGGAVGIDDLAEKYADKHRISKMILRPHYDLYGKAAPLRRNEEMIQLCDRLLVIYDGKSRGTKYTIDYAKKLGKPIDVITVSDAE